MSAAQYKQTNPFTPIFGKVPAVMAGREAIIQDMIDALEGNGSSPDLCSIFTGARGTGKTALLTYLGFRAEQAGWIVASTTAGEGMLEDLLQRARAASAHLIDQSSRAKLTGVSIANIGGVTWASDVPSPENWRTAMVGVLDALAETDTGILFSVDEVDASLEEMAQLASVFQLFVRENRKVALIMAGLPYQVSALLSGKTTSFLRRAARHELGSIPAYEIKEAFRLTVEEGGKEIDSNALAMACDAAGGFPFMFQLVGYRSWNAARDSEIIGCDAVSKGIEIAKEELASRVYDATVAELSRGDLEFLEAMRCEGSTTRDEVIAATKRPGNWASRYRRRMLEAGVIDEPRPGEYRFALPGFGEYLKKGGNRE